MKQLSDKFFEIFLKKQEPEPDEFKCLPATVQAYYNKELQKAIANMAQDYETMRKLFSSIELSNQSNILEAYALAIDKSRSVKNP